VPPAPGCPGTGPASSEVTRAICRVPSTPFSRAPRYTLPVHLCRFRVRSSCRSCFLERSSRRDNPISPDDASRSSLSAGRGLFTPFPSATTFVLTLGAGSPCADWPCAGTLGLAASGVLTRFIATHVSILTSDTSRTARAIPSPAYGTLRYHSDVRGQMSDVRTTARPCAQGHAASWQSAGIRRAIAARWSRRRSRGPGNNSTTAASRRQNRSP
jgi:hypothetical protein